MIKYFLFLQFLLLSSTITGQRSGKDYAVFFVTSKFDNGWTSLEYAPKEVSDIGEVLREQYGFDVRIVSEVNRDKIVQTLAEYKRKTYGPQDQLLLFFSMHGVHDPDSDQGYLIPKNGLYDDPSYETWYSHAALRDLAHSIKCPRILVALDACYSGIFGKSRSKPDAPDWEEKDLDCKTKISLAFEGGNTRKYLAAGGDTRVPAKSEFAAQWLSALQNVSIETGMLSYLELLARLDELKDPKPTWGNFVTGTDGNFAFIRKDACITQKQEESPKQKTLLRQTEAWIFADSSKNYAKYIADWCPGGVFCEIAQTRLKTMPQKTEKPSKYRMSSIVQEAKISPDQIKITEDSLSLIFIRGGTLAMGCTSEQQGCAADETPVHNVNISDFYIGKYEVTTKLWKQVMGADSGSKYCDDCPVAFVSWLSIQGFLQNLNAKFPGHNYRLPTEAEWEYAARGGRKSNGYPFAGSNNFDEVAWYKNNSNEDCQPVGRKKANELGLFDMSGNVAEWCSDWYGKYTLGSQKNPIGAETGLYRVFRGGSVFDGSASCRISNRENRNSNSCTTAIGFRLACSK